MRELFPQPPEKQQQLNQGSGKPEPCCFSLFFPPLLLSYSAPAKFKKYAEGEKSDLLVQGLLASRYVFGAAVSFGTAI